MTPETMPFTNMAGSNAEVTLQQCEGVEMSTQAERIREKKGTKPVYFGIDHR